MYERCARNYVNTDQVAAFRFSETKSAYQRAATKSKPNTPNCCQWVRIQKASSDFYLFKTICQCRVFAPDQHWLSRNAFRCRCLCVREFAFCCSLFDYSSNDMLSELMVLFAFTKCQIYDLRIDIFSAMHSFQAATISIMLLKKKCRVFTLLFAHFICKRLPLPKFVFFIIVVVILLVFPHRLRCAQFIRISLSVFNLAVFFISMINKTFVTICSSMFRWEWQRANQKIKNRHHSSISFAYISFHFIFCAIVGCDKQHFDRNNN